MKSKLKKNVDLAMIWFFFFFRVNLNIMQKHKDDTMKVFNQM